MTKLPSGRWRAQVRRKGQHASRTFRLKSDAEGWANEAEDKASRGKSVEAVEIEALARVALRRLCLVDKGNERDRRPTREELDCIIRLHDGNSRQTIPLGRIVTFAVATAMRQ